MHSAHYINNKLWFTRRNISRLAFIYTVRIFHCISSCSSGHAWWPWYRYSPKISHKRRNHTCHSRSRNTFSRDDNQMRGLKTKQRECDIVIAIVNICLSLKSTAAGICVYFVDATKKSTHVDTHSIKCLLFCFECKLRESETIYKTRIPHTHDDWIGVFVEYPCQCVGYSYQHLAFDTRSSA